MSKDDWLRAALQVLEEEGVDAVMVERLARDLKISKSGFYWHFVDRQDFLRHVLEYWEREYTGVVADNTEVQALEPIERIRRTVEMIREHDLARFDLSIRAWAEKDASARRAMTHAIETRLGFLRQAFREIGFEGEQLEMRTRLFVCYYAWEQTTFDDLPSRDPEAEREALLRLLTSCTVEQERPVKQASP